MSRVRASSLPGFGSMCPRGRFLNLDAPTSARSKSNRAAEFHSSNFLAGVTSASRDGRPTVLRSQSRQGSPGAGERPWPGWRQLANDTDCLWEAVREIHAAPLNPDLWPGALARMAAAVSASKGALFDLDMETRQMVALTGHAHEPAI